MFLLLPTSGTSPTPLLLPALNVSLGIKGRSGTGTTLGVPWVKGEGGERTKHGAEAWGGDGGKFMGREGEAQMLFSAFLFFGSQRGIWLY